MSKASGFLQKLKERLHYALFQDIGHGLLPPSNFRNPSPG